MVLPCRQARICEETGIGVNGGPLAVLLGWTEPGGLR